MESFEPKKLALIRILQIFRKHSDYDHLLTQDDIAGYLERDYGIAIERKAISRNISLLREAGIEIESKRSGSYLEDREFEDSELRMLIDGILSSKYITAKHSSDLINRICNLSNKYFRSHVKNIYSVNDWGKTDNQALFYNIELIDDAIETNKCIVFDYNKYGVDKKLHRSAMHLVSPYQLILHNQRYYLMGLNEKWHNIGYYRLDHISNMRLSEHHTITYIHTVPGYENGIDYKDLASSRPYMFADKAEIVEFISDEWMIDQIVEWFGFNFNVTKLEDDKIKVSLKVSPAAMEHWAMQYINYVEITSPEFLRDQIIQNLIKAKKQYTKSEEQ